MDPRPTWEGCCTAAGAARRYVSLVLETLVSPAATLPPEDQRAKDDYEWQQPLHVLKPLREVCSYRGQRSIVSRHSYMKIFAIDFFSHSCYRQQCARTSIYVDKLRGLLSNKRREGVVSSCIRCRVIA